MSSDDARARVRERRRSDRWHTVIVWRGSAGLIAVNGGFTERTRMRRLRIARQLATWAWGGLPRGAALPARQLAEARANGE